MVHSTSTITLTVGLDENKIAETLHFSAEDGDITEQETPSFFLSVWDAENKQALSVDLWTKQMSLNDMKFFFYQMFATMSEKYLQATDDEEMYTTMQDFCKQFAKKLIVEP